MAMIRSSRGVEGSRACWMSASRWQRRPDVCPRCVSSRRWVFVSVSAALVSLSVARADPWAK